MVQTLLQRIQTTQLYFDSLEQTLVEDWFLLYNQYFQGHLEFVKALSLIHPLHYEELSGSNYIRGPRSFSKEPALSTIRCRASLIWGYECHFHSQISGGVVADHLFPYSFGGPTISLNKVYLCKLHNELKGHDLHLYCWENGEPEWLKDLLRRIYSLKMQSTYGL